MRRHCCHRPDGNRDAKREPLNGWRPTIVFECWKKLLCAKPSMQFAGLFHQKWRARRVEAAVRRDRVKVALAGKLTRFYEALLGTAGLEDTPRTPRGEILVSFRDCE